MSNEVENMEPIERTLYEFKESVNREMGELKMCQQKHETRLNGHDKEFLTIKGEIRFVNTRLDTLTETLKEITDNTKWIKRAITKGAISFVFGIISVILVGLVTFYITNMGG